MNEQTKVYGVRFGVSEPSAVTVSVYPSLRRPENKVFRYPANDDGVAAFRYPKRAQVVIFCRESTTIDFTHVEIITCDDILPTTTPNPEETTVTPGVTTTAPEEECVFQVCLCLKQMIIPHLHQVTPEELKSGDVIDLDDGVTVQYNCKVKYTFAEPRNVGSFVALSKAGKEYQLVLEVDGEDQVNNFGNISIQTKNLL